MLKYYTLRITFFATIFQIVRENFDNFNKIIFNQKQKFMKRKLVKRVVTMAVASLVFFGCKKQSSPSPESTAPLTVHQYGLNPMTPDQWSYVPVFSQDVLEKAAKGTGLSAGTLPSSFLLASPAVRDQGQIGACTGFCGAESDEILNYYKSVSSPVTTTSLDSATGLAAAVSTEIPALTLFGPSHELSPLFIYYVERCVINGQPITADGGAAMVNIPEALQGLSRNTGTGTALTKTISGVNYSFSGDCYENLYAYPSTGSHSSAQYTTAPASSAIANAPAFKIAAESGTTGSSGTTAHGYYVINSATPVNDVKVAIYNRKPVMMGINVYDNSSYQYFEGLDIPGYSPNKFVYNPLTASGNIISGLSLLGGHAIPIIGYIDEAAAPGGGYFIVENSWNTYWGYHGYFYMPYSVLANTKIVPAGNLYVSII